MTQKDRTNQELVEEIRLLKKRISEFELIDAEHCRQREQILSLNQELQVILDSSAWMIFYKDKENRFIRVNNAFAKVNCKAKEDIEGKKLVELYPAEDADNYWKDDKEVISTGKPKLNIIEQMQTPQGVIWIQLDKIPYKNSKGEIIGVIGFCIDITERIKIQQTLETSKNLLSQMGKMAKVGGWEFDVQTLKQVWTEEVYHIHEIDDITYHPTVEEGIDFYVPGSREIIREAVKRLIEFGESFDKELELITAKGNRIWVHAIGKPVLENGKPKKGYGTFQDITELKRVSMELEQSTRKMRALFDQTFQFIGLMDIDGILIEANRTALEFSGVNPESVLNKPFWQGPWWTHSRELQEKLRQSIKKAALGECIRFEATHVAKDGSTHYVDFSLKPVKDQNDRVIFLLPEGRDITDMKMVEKSLRTSEERYRSIFLSTQDAVMTLEPPSWKFTSCNPAALGIFKVKSEAEFLFCEPWELSPKLQPDGRFSDEKAKDMIDIAMRDGSNFFEWTHKNVYGEEFFAEVLLSRVEVEKKVFLQALVRDITERKRTQEELDRAYYSLEHKVKERTKELKERLDELERFRKATIEREFRIKELRDEIKRLKNGK